MVVIGNLAVVVGVFASGLITALATAVYIHFDIRRLERRYAEKNALLDKQLATVEKLIARLDKAVEREQKLEVRGLVLGDLLTRARPIIETLDAPGGMAFQVSRELERQTQ